MQLTGYRRACAKRNGGIRSVALVGADAVETVGYDAANDCYTAVGLKAGYSFAVYRFKEDEAEYAEKIVSNSIDLLVSHTLTLLLERMDAASALAVEELAKSSPAGLVAIVTSNNGVSALVGYSNKFGLEYPLRLQTAAGTSGLKITDVSGETITLASVDTQKAKAYTGTAPQ